MAVLGCPLGHDVEVKIKTENITINKSRDLHRRVIELKKNHSWLKKYPIGDQETLEEWQLRVVEEVAKDESESKKRRDGEDNQQYLDRVLAVDNEDLNLYQDCLKLVTQLFGTAESLVLINDETFGEANIETVVRFLKDVFAKARLNVDEVFPKRFS